MAAPLMALSWFVPIFAFLLVFIVIYALLKKTSILGSSDMIMLFISFILASFFVVQVHSFPQWEGSESGHLSFPRLVDLEHFVVH